MTAVFWVFILVFWVYFFLLSVEPDGAIETATSTRLPRRFMFPGDVLRAAVCATPIAVLNDGFPLDNNQFITWVALSILAEPLLIPSSLQPTAIHTLSVSTFVLRWLVTELDRLVKTSLLALLVLGILFVVAMPKRYQEKWLDDHFTFVDRLPGSLELPLTFYVTCMLVLGVRSMLLLGIEKRPILAATCGWIIGTTTLIYFYNITGQIHISEHEWEYPAGGLLISLALKCTIAFHLATIDRKHEFGR